MPWRPSSSEPAAARARILTPSLSLPRRGGGDSRRPPYPGYNRAKLPKRVTVMAEPPAGQGPRASQVSPLGREWAEALAAGASPEELAGRIAAAAPDDAAAGVRGLTVLSGPLALPVLAALAGSSSAQLAVAAAEALASIREAAAADALDQLARSSPDRVVQKAARRFLHRLSSQGVRPSPAAPRAVAGVGGRSATLYRAIASSFDGTGTRSLWLAAERPLGGIYMIATAIDDVGGLTDCVGRDTTRKRFAEQEQTMRDKDPMAWVELPLDYARQLIGEAVETSRSAGSGVPSGYVVWAEMIGAPSEPFREALIYAEISAFEARMHPTLEAEGPRLFEQPEIEPWFFPPEQVRKWVQQLTESATSRLILTPESEGERQQRLVKEAMGELLPPRERRGLRRRLEETAYIFQRTDRQTDARRAVAAAATIEEVRPLRPAHPFLRALVERSFRIALEVDRSGFEPIRLARAR